MSVAALALLAAGCAAHTTPGGHGSFSAAVTSTGKGSNYALEAYFGAHVSADQVVSYEQSVVINIPGVASTGGWQGGPLIIRTQTPGDLQRIRSIIVKSPLVIRVTEGPPPNPPAKFR